MNKRVRYRTKTVKTGGLGLTGFHGGTRKVARLISQGWEVVSEQRHGWSGNIIVLRKEKQ